MPVEIGVGGALQPVRLDESDQTVNTAEVLAHILSQVRVVDVCGKKEASMQQLGNHDKRLTITRPVKHSRPAT